jgi:hypothetical protein
LRRVTDNTADVQGAVYQKGHAAVNGKGR